MLTKAVLLMKKVVLIAILSFCGILSACYEENDSVPSTVQLLAGNDAFGKGWKITGIEVSGLGKLSPFDCTADNNIIYYPNGRHEVSEGYEKCDPNDPPAYVGSWSFNSPKDSLFITLGDSVRSWYVDALTQTSMRLTSRFDSDKRTYVFARR